MGDPATCDEDLPVLRLGGPPDLVDAVPYLLGFHPRDSVVLMAVTGGHRRAGLTLRIDLADAVSSDEAGRQCLEHLLRAGADALLLVVYAPPVAGASEVSGDDRPGPDLPHADLVHRLQGLADAAGLDVLEAVLVGGERWWSYLCTNPMCCPAEGTPVRSTSGPSAVVAAATVAGMTAAADRDEVARSLEPLPAARRARLDEAVRAEAERWSAAAAGPRRDAALGAWERAVTGRRGTSTLPIARAAVLLVGLADVPVRDECILGLAVADRPAAFDLVRQLARRASAPWDVAPYTLTAWLAWLTGDGVRARVAVDRALLSDPDYRLALLVEQLLDQAVDPRDWDADPGPPAPFGSG